MGSWTRGAAGAFALASLLAVGRLALAQGLAGPPGRGPVVQGPEMALPPETAPGFDPLRSGASPPQGAVAQRDNSPPANAPPPAYDPAPPPAADPAPPPLDSSPPLGPASPFSAEPMVVPPPVTIPPLSTTLEPLNLGPVTPVVRLPGLPNDPPVPYFRAMQPLDDIPPGNPRFELPGTKLGWLFNVEVGYVQPLVHNSLNSGSLPVGNVPGSVQVPQVRSDFGVMPTFDVGYRFEEGLGEAHVLFRFLNDSTTRDVANFDSAGAGSVTSRVSLDVLDLQYGFLEFNPGRVPLLNPLFMIPGRLGLRARPEEQSQSPLMIKWFFGARIANAYFDSQGSGAVILNERVTNNFVGGGPQIGVDLTRPFGDSPFSLYARFQTSGLAGEATQSYARTETLGGGGTATGYARPAGSATGVPVLDLWFGARYAPRWGKGMLRMTAGYQYEQWFYLDASSAELTLNGVFFRGEYGF